MKTEPLYHVQRCKRDGTYIGRVHAAKNDDTTVCTKTIDKGWWIWPNNTPRPPVNCPKCTSAILVEADGDALRRTRTGITYGVVPEPPAPVDQGFYGIR